MIGTKIGSYILEDIIGKGGTGIVYRARHKNLPAVCVAVKFLAPAYCQDREIYTRFVREAQMLAQLRHCRNIIAIQDVGDYQAQPYLIMEYQEETLSQRLRRGPLSLAETLRIAEGVLRAFEVCHAGGIVHRDVKPSNIFLRSEDGSVALGDFGIALAASGERLTGVGFAPGTPEYMAPEQVQGGEADARADLYALGLVMCEMVSGELPFQAATRNDYYYHQMHTSPTLPPGLPAEVAAALRRVLAKAPAERFASASEMRAALQGRAVAPTPVEKPLLVPEQPPRAQTLSASNRVLPIVLVLGILLLGIVALNSVITQQQVNARLKQTQAGTEAALRREQEAHATETERLRAEAKRLAAQRESVMNTAPQPLEGVKLEGVKQEDVKQEPSSLWEGERFPMLRTRRLTAAEISSWPKSDIVYAINEIAARQGYDFHEKKWRDIFGQFSWYRSRRKSGFKDFEPLLQGDEKANYRILVNARSHR